MSNRIEAPGHTALWTEAALRALTGTAFLCDQDGDADMPHEPMTADYARVIALDAMAIATAFERACEEAHAAEQEAARERVQAIGRFSYGVSTRFFRVKRVAGVSAFLDSEDGEVTNMMAMVCDLLGGGEGWTPAPLDALPPTGGEERA